MSSEVLPTQTIPSKFEFEGNRANDKVLGTVNDIDAFSSNKSVVNDAQKLTQDILKPDKKELNEEGAANVELLATEAEIDEAISLVSSFINQPPRNVNFIKDDESGKTVIKVFDIESKELIKQFPSEELVSIAKKIQALHQEVGEKAGIFIDKRI